MADDDKKEPRWAIVTLHPWLPTKVEQVARIRAWGLPEQTIDGTDVSSIIVDDVRKVKRTTNWPAQLVERFAFIANAKRVPLSEGLVFFANPLAVGFSAKLARDTIEGLWTPGLHVYVHSIGAVYVPGDDLTEFLETVDRDSNAAHVRAWRARKPKTKRKS